MKGLLLVMTTVFLLLMAACNGGQTEAINTYSDPASAIDVAVNREFVIALEANSTTGYHWQESHDETILKLVSDEYQTDKKSQDVVGAGGTQYYKFQALKKGETKITLVYRRPWDKPAPQDTTKEFTVNIK